MKFERKHKLWIIIGIGAIFIIYGLLGSVLKFNVDPKIVDQVSFILMIIAFALLFSNRKKKTDKNTSSVDPNSDTHVSELEGDVTESKPESVVQDNNNSIGDAGESVSTEKTDDLKVNDDIDSKPDSNEK